MFELLSNKLCQDSVIYVSLRHIVLIISLTWTKIFPLILAGVGDDITLERTITVCFLKTIQVVVGDKARTEVNVLVTCLIQCIDVFACLNDIGNNQCFLSFSQGCQCHLFVLCFSVNTSIVLDLGIIVKPRMLGEG